MTYDHNLVIARGKICKRKRAASRKFRGVALPAVPALDGRRRGGCSLRKGVVMATAEETRERSASAGERWYALDPEDVVGRLGVVPDSGLSADEAAERLRRDGPNALPVEKPPSTARRFLAEYTSYMQLILVGAAIVSLVIKEWSTAIVLIVITLFNAFVGLRQQGKAESAMNALQSMMKATARVRRDGAEAEIPAEQLVVGDVVLIAAGDEVPADGRIVTASALQIDESALTGESVPAAKDAETLSGGDDRSW